MSAVTKKKFVVNEALQRYQLPDEKNYIVKVTMKIKWSIYWSTVF